MLPPHLNKSFQELKGSFSFFCHPSIECFNKCCQKIIIWLTPYDFLRLRTELGLSSNQFLDKYCTIKQGQNGWFIPQLTMSTKNKKCPFSSSKGCKVYINRPGVCRMYPLGQASPSKGNSSFFLIQEKHCLGIKEKKKQWNIEDWIENQDLKKYIFMNDMFIPIVTSQPPDLDPQIIEKKMQMFFATLYRIESFRNFLIKGNLTSHFSIEKEYIEKIKKNDEDLLEFAYNWLKFSIFGENIKKIKLKNETKN